MDRKRADSEGADAKKSSPVRDQWEAMKRQHPGRILLFQLGDFYETFEGDARTVARVCGITLTSRELSKGDRVPLAGVPIHRAAPHIGKLIAAGLHVAICDQVSEPVKGLVEREVTRALMLLRLSTLATRLGYRRKAATLSTHGDFIRGMAQA